MLTTVVTRLRAKMTGEAAKVIFISMFALEVGWLKEADTDPSNQPLVSIYVVADG